MLKWYLITISLLREIPHLFKDDFFREGGVRAISEISRGGGKEFLGSRGMRIYGGLANFQEQGEG